MVPERLRHFERGKKITPTGYQPIRVNQERFLIKCESGGARTLDPRLKRPLLYQLSYRFVKSFKDPKDKEMTISKSNRTKNFFLKFCRNNLHKQLVFDTLRTEVTFRSIP